jgi:hypothetical protein
VLHAQIQVRLPCREINPGVVQERTRSKNHHFPESFREARVLSSRMNVKKILGSVLGFHMMRHRQHKRFIGNALMQARRFGPGRGLLMLGAMALGSYYLQKRHRAGTHAAELSEAGANI